MIGKQLQSLRKKNGITQQELADRIGCSKNHISKVERGAHLNIKTLKAIANEFGQDIEIKLVDYVAKES